MASKDAPLRASLEEAWKARNSGTPTLNDLWLFDLPIGRDKFAKAAAACEEVWKKPVPPAGAKPGAGVNFVETSKVLAERFAQFNSYLDSEMETPLDFFKILKWASEPAMAKARTSLWQHVWKELYLLAVAHGRLKAVSRAWNHLPTQLATVELKAVAAGKPPFDPSATFVAGSKGWGFHPKDAELIYLPFIDRNREARGRGTNPELGLLRARIFMHHKDVQGFQEAQKLRRAASIYAMFKGGLNLLNETELRALSVEIADTDPFEALNRTWLEVDRRYRIDEGEKSLFSVVWINPGSRYDRGLAPCVYIELDAFPGHIFQTFGRGVLPALAQDQLFRLVAQSLTALGEFLIAYLTVLGFVVDIITAGGASTTLRGLVYAFFREKLIEAAVDKGLDAAKINSMPLRLLVQAGVGMKTGTAGRKLDTLEDVERKAATVTRGKPRTPGPATSAPHAYPSRGAGSTDHFAIYDSDAARVVTAEMREKISKAARLQYAAEEDVYDELTENVLEGFADRMVQIKQEFEELLAVRGTPFASQGAGTSMYHVRGAPSAKGIGKAGASARASTRAQSAASKKATRFANSEAYRALEHYKDWVPPEDWKVLLAHRDAIRKGLLASSRSPYPMRQANQDLKNILDKAKELSGEEHALIDVLAQFEVDNYLAIPRRGDKGAPMLDVGIRLKKGEPYSHVLVEAKGDTSTRLGKVTRKEYYYNKAKKLVYRDMPSGGFVKQGTGEWYYQKFAEIYRAGQNASPPNQEVMDLALELMDAAKKGKVHFRVMKASPGSVKDIDDTATVALWFSQKLAPVPKGTLPIPHSVAP